MSLSLNAGTGLGIKPEETIIDAVQPKETELSGEYRAVNVEIFTDGGEEIENMYADTPADMLLAPSTESVTATIKAYATKVYQWIREFIAKIMARIKAIFSKTSAKEIAETVQTTEKEVEKFEETVKLLTNSPEPEVKKAFTETVSEEAIKESMSSASSNFSGHVSNERALKASRKAAKFVRSTREILEVVNNNKIFNGIYLQGTRNATAKGTLGASYGVLVKDIDSQMSLIEQGFALIRSIPDDNAKAEDLAKLNEQIRFSEFFKESVDFESIKGSISPVQIDVNSFTKSADVLVGVVNKGLSVYESRKNEIDQFFGKQSKLDNISANFTALERYFNGDVFKEAVNNARINSVINDYFAKLRTFFKTVSDMTTVTTSFKSVLLKCRTLLYESNKTLMKYGTQFDQDASVEAVATTHEIKEIEDLESTIESFINLSKIISTEGMSLSHAQEAVAIDPSFPLRNEAMYTSIPTGTLLTASTEAIGEKIKAGMKKIYDWIIAFINKVIARFKSFFSKDSPKDLFAQEEKATEAVKDMDEARVVFEAGASTEVRKSVDEDVYETYIKKEKSIDSDFSQNVPEDVIKLVKDVREMVTARSSDTIHSGMYFYDSFTNAIINFIPSASKQLEVLLTGVLAVSEFDSSNSENAKAKLMKILEELKDSKYPDANFILRMERHDSRPEDRVENLKSFSDCYRLISVLEKSKNKTKQRFKIVTDFFESKQPTFESIKSNVEKFKSIFSEETLNDPAVKDLLKQIRLIFLNIDRLTTVINSRKQLAVDIEKFSVRMANFYKHGYKHLQDATVENRNSEHELQEIFDLAQSNEAALNRVVDYFGNVNMFALNTEIAKESYDNTPASIDFDDGEFDMQSLKGSFDIGLEAVTDDSRSTFTKVIDWIVKKIRVIFAKVKSLFAKKEKAFSKEDIRDPYEKFLDNLNKVKSASVDLSKSNYMHELAKACLSVKINYDSNLFLASFDIHGRATTSQELDRCFKALRKIGNDLKSSSSLNNPVDFAKTVRDTTDKIDTTNSFFKSVGETSRSVSKTVDGMLKYLTTYGNNVSDLGDAKVDLNLSMFFDELDKDIFKANEKLKQTDGTNGEKDLATAFLALSSKLSTFFATVIRGRGTIESSLENVNRDLEHLLKQITKSSNESYSSVDPEQYLENVDFEADLQSFVSLTELGLEGNEDKRSRISKIIDWIKARIKNMFAKLREFYKRFWGKADYDMSSLEASLKSVKESNLNLDEGKNKAYMENLKARLIRLLKTEPLLYSIYIGREKMASDHLKDIAASIKELTAITKIRMKTFSKSEADTIYSQIKVINRKMRTTWLTVPEGDIAEPQSSDEILEAAGDCIQALGTLFKLTKESSLMASSITELESSIERFIGELEIQASEMYKSSDGDVHLTGTSLRSACSVLGSIIASILKSQMRIFNSDSASRSSEGIKSSLDEILGVKEIESNESVSVDATDSLMGHTPKALRGISQDAVNTAPIEANDRTPTSLARFGNSAAYADYV